MCRPAPIKRAFSKLLIQIPILLSVHSVPPSVLIRCQYPEAAENFETRGSSSSTEQYAYPCSDFPKCPLHCSLAQATEPVCNLHRGLAGRGGGGSHVACLNFKTSCVGIYRCLSLIVSFAVTVTIWPREVVSCRDFILPAVTTFWAMSLVGIYPGRASSQCLVCL